MSTAFGVFLGSEERSAEVMRELQQIASTSPLTLDSLGSAMQTMLGFNIEGDKAMTILRQLGDISGGDAERLKSLALSFAQASSTGRLMGQDLLQMINAGFNPLVEISRTTGQSMADLKEAMSAGAISIEMLEGAFATATSEGGKFHGMLDRQGETLKGASAQLSGAIDDMYNKIGQSNQDLIAGGYRLATTLVQNYEAIGDAIMALVAIVGVHKAAIIARNAVEVGGARLNAIVGAQAEAVALERVASAEIKESLTKQGLTAETHAYNVALKQEIIAELENVKAKLSKQRVDSSLILSKETQALLTKQATLEQALETAGVNANTASKSLNAKITTVLSGAVARLNAAIASNAWTIALVAVTALAYGLYKLITHQTDSEKAQAKLNESLQEGEKSISREKMEVEVLFDALKDAKEGTDEWREAREAILAKYGSILSNQRAEVKNLTDLAEAQRLVTQEVERTARARAKEKATNTAMESYSDIEARETKTILDNLKYDGDYNDEEARRIYNKLKGAFDRGEYRFIQGQVHFLDKDLRQKLNALGGIDYADIREAFGRIAEAKANLDSSIKDIEAQFGVESNSQPKTEQIPPAIKTIAQSIDQTRAKVKTLKQELQDLRSGKTSSHDYTKDIQAKEKELKEAESNLNSLLGTTTPKGKDRTKAELQREADELHKSREQQAREAERQRIDFAHSLEELEISLMQEGQVKALAQLDLKHQKELEALRRHEEDYLEAKRESAERLFSQDPKNKDKAFDRSSVSLTPEEQALFQNKRTYIESRQAQERRAYEDEERRAMQEYLAEYGAYQERRLAIAELYEQKIAKANTEGERLKLGKERDSELSKLDAEANETTDAIARLFSDLSKSTSRDMRIMAEEAREALDYITAGIYKTDSQGNPLFGITPERLKTLSSSATEIKNISDQIERVENKANEADTALGKLSKGFEALMKHKQGTEGWSKAIGLLQQGFGELQGIVGSLTDSFRGFVDITGDSSPFSDVMNMFSEFSTLASNVIQGLAQGDIVGGIVAGVTSIAGALSKAIDAGHEQRIQHMQNNVDKLKKEYDKLGKAIEGAFSKDASRLYEEQNRLLLQTAILRRAQAIEEEDKKKSDLNKVKSYNDEANNLLEQIDENKRKAVDAIFGQDIKSAITDFANAYASAWTSGESQEETARAQVRKMMRSMILEQIKSLTSPDMQRLRDKMKLFFADNVFTETEAKELERMSLEIQQRTDEYAKRGANARLLSGLDAKGATPEASRGAWQSMTQETANELNGRFTAIQQSVLGIAGVMNDLRSIGALSMGYLEDLSKSNRELYRISARLDEIERNTRALR